jgi:hypothetical protein
MFVVLRLLSLLLIVMALMLLGADLITSLEKGGVLTVRSIEQVWGLFARNSEAAFLTWLPRAMPAVAAGWVATLLSLPAWGPTGVLGVILAFLFGRRTADIS